MLRVSSALVIALLLLSMATTQSFMVSTTSMTGNRLDRQSTRLKDASARASFKRRKLIAGNWKMNTDVKSGQSLASEVARLYSSSASSTASKNNDMEVLLIPPLPSLEAVKTAIKDTDIALGAQTCHYELSGAYTGAVSTSMLLSCGVSYALAGHSERRKLFGETDEIVNKIVTTLLSQGIKPIMCIGESETDMTLGVSLEKCILQVARGFRDLTPEHVAKSVIAYEPIWAIGTGKTPTPDFVQRIHAGVRGWIAQKHGNQVADQVRIQYGGSVSASNVKDFLKCPDVDGVLVGGASLKADSFMSIMEASV